MSKMLSIEELKALKINDWVWIKRLDVPEDPQGGYYQKKLPLNESVINEYFAIPFSIVATLAYKDYGKTWVAYKNKEQAEAKSKTVELPCNIGDPIWVVYRDFDHGFNEYKIYESICTGFAFEHGTEIRIITAFCCYDFDRVGSYTDKSEAERRLAELKGE